MLWWIVDHAYWFYAVFGFVAAALAIIWWQNRRKEILYALAGTIALIVIVVLLTFLIVTDRMSLTRSVYEMAAAVGDNKPELIARHLAKDFEYQGIVTKQNARAKIGQYISRYRLEYVHAFYLEIEELDRSRNHARVYFKMRVDSALEKSLLLATRLEYVLEQDGIWRVKSAKIYNPVVNTDTEIQIPLP